LPSDSHSIRGNARLIHAHKRNLAGRGYRVRREKRSANGRVAPMPRMVPLALLGLVLTAGALAMAITLGRDDLRWLGWLALLPLLVNIRWLTPLGAGLGGLLWGAAFFAFATTLVTTGVPSTPLAVLLLCAVPGLYCGLGAWYRRWHRFDPLALGVGWLLVELALLPLGLERGLLGQVDVGGPVVGLATGVLGYAFAGFVVAAASAAAVEFIRCKVSAALVWTRVAVFTNLAHAWLQHEFVVFPRVYSPQACPRGPPCA